MQQEELPISLKDQFLISPLGQWMTLHRNFLMNFGVVFLLALVWGFVKLVSAPNVEAMRQISETRTAWKAKPDDEQLYQAFQKSLAKVPSMQEALGPEIAQILLSVGRVDEAEKWAERPMNDLREIAPMHAEYAAVSLIMAKKSYQEALEKSVSLKEKMPKKTILYCQNLMRIAFLQQLLNNPAGELVAWCELESFIESDPALAERALKGLNGQKVSFNSYIEHRKTACVQ